MADLTERQKEVTGWIVCVGLAVCTVIVGLAVSIWLWRAIL